MIAPNAQEEMLNDNDISISKDDPTRLAEILVAFWRRNERVLPVGIKKVGDS